MMAPLAKGDFGTRRGEKRYGLAAFALGLLLAAALPSAAHAQNSGIPCKYEVTHIIQGPYCPGWGYPTTVGTAISPSGRYVCGYYNYCSIGGPRAFLYDTQTQQFTTLPFFSGSFTEAKDVNEEYVVGQGDGLGFLYHIATGAVTTLLPAVPPSVGTCTVTGINSSNVVCGTRTIQISPERTSAFIWSAKTGFADLGVINGQSTNALDINEAGAVTGRMVVNNALRPYLWHNGELTDLGSLFGLDTYPRAINDRMQIVGGGLASLTTSAPFIWSNGVMTALPLLPGCEGGGAVDINNASLVIGSCGVLSSGQSEPFIWVAGTIAPLRPLVQPGTGLYVTRVLAQNDLGQITGDAYVPGATAAYVLTPVFPPPADVDQDCRVNVNDLLLVINEWGKAKSIADINGDGIVNALDLQEVIKHWTVN